MSQGTKTPPLSKAADYGAGLTTKRPADLINDESPASRALALGSYFLSGCMAINASQFLGAPLYLINQDWYNAWIAFTKQSYGLLMMTMTQCWAPTIMRVSGHKSVRGQLLQTTEGNLVSNFPQRLVLIANHQIYTDWLYLWWIGYTAGMHGRIYIVLKESLKKIPILGWGMQFSQFLFLKRNWEQDKPRLAKHLQSLNRPSDPMWLMMFPEGTNLADSTRENSKKWAEKNDIDDMKHQLLPRSTGLQFCLQELRQTVEYVYDCTIAYEGVPRGQYAQDIFTLGASYFGGNPPKSVNMYWRRFPISSIPLDDSHAFEHWLRARWTEKDRLIEGYLQTGRFPADRGVSRSRRDGKLHRGAGYIETEIKPTYWYEFLQVFAPLGLFALVLYVFYGALPRRIIKTFDKRLIVDETVKEQIKLPEKPQLLDAVLRALGEEQGLKNLKTTQKLSIDMATLQKALQNGFLREKLGIEGTPSLASIQKVLQSGILGQKIDIKGMPSLAVNNEKAQKAAIKGSTASKPSTSGTTKTKPQASIAKTQQSSTISKPPKPKTQLSSAPKKLDPKNTANSAPKKVIPKKPQVINAQSAATKKLDTKSTTASAPKKLDVKREAQLAAKRDTAVAPKKLNKVAASASKQGAPKKSVVTLKATTASTQPQSKTKIVKRV